MDVVLETLLMTLNRCLSMAGILDYVRWFAMNIFLLHDAQVKKQGGGDNALPIPANLDRF